MKPPVFNPSWPEDIKALYAHDMQEIWDRSIAVHVWNQYHNQLDYYLAIAGRQRKNILDVGCAQATLALLLAERGHSVTAVDLRPGFLEYARARYTQGEIKFVTANILEDNITGDYDLIFANQIVEHLVYPELLLRRLMERLKPGGRLVMTTPNGDYLKNKLPSFKQLGDVKNWEHMQNTADGDGHFYAYLAEELTEKFKNVGFSSVQAHYFESPFISGHMKVRLAHEFIPTVLLKLVDKFIVSTPWLKRKLSHQMMVTGIRPESE